MHGETSQTTPPLPAVAELTAREFQAGVLDLNPTVAVFDCDGTLWSGDAGSEFMGWSIEHGLLSRESSEWLAERYRLYKLGRVSELAMCGEMVQVYAGLRETDLRRAAGEFFRSHVERHIFAELRELVAALQSRQVEVWAVSSTNNWVIEEGVRSLGIGADRVLAARVAVLDGLATERLLDVPTDQGKVDALVAAGVTAPDAVFGNSVHDAAMLALARRAFPVNPTHGLVERSRAEGWAVFYPAAVRS